MRQQRCGARAWVTWNSAVLTGCMCVALWGCSDDGLSAAETDAAGTTGADVDDGDSESPIPPETSASTSEGTDPTLDPDTGVDSSTTGGGTASDPTGAESSGTGEPEEMPEGIYVRAEDGLDSNEGTADAPVRTIAQGIALAGEQGLSIVYIAAGDYAANSDNNDVVEVVEGVSLRGGYDPTDWTNWDPSAFASSISDAGVAAAGFNPGNPHRALLVPLGVTGETVVEGLALQASAAPNSAAAVVQGDATLRGNTLLGGGGPLSTALFLGGSAASISANLIDGVEAPKGQPSFGVRGTGGSPSLHANEIRSGEGMTNRAVVLGMSGGTLSSNYIVAEAGQGGGGRAVELTESSIAVVSNTIVVDGTDTSFHVLSAGAVAPVQLDNNNFISLATTAWCYASADGTDVGTARNNNLGCSNLYNGSAVHVTIAALEDALGEASGNVAEASGVESPLESPRLADDGSTLCAVARGGLTVAEIPDTDIDANTRTEAWSIGAHELDGACL